MAQLIPIKADEWLKQLKDIRSGLDVEAMQHAINLYESTAARQSALCIADILLKMGLDNETLLCSLYTPALKSQLMTLDVVLEEIGENGHRLLSDVMQMQSLGTLQGVTYKSHHHMERLRKLLLAIVTDVRAVLIVLAERLCVLRNAKSLTTHDQQALAHETLNVYAPLANRLGIWQLKWEIEDFCLRYLEPDIYKKIAKGIAARREERERYVLHFQELLTHQLTVSNIKNFQVTGRVKHIYSIYKKMQRKNANLENIYDMIALRVMTQSIEDCYTVLSVLQMHWSQISAEFDDYIANPKPNGYQSIHTVLIGPNNNHIEIQIRTEEMHRTSELGVAAHWRYKEGVLQTSSYEAKIALLRQVMAWQKELTVSNESYQEQAAIDLFADRVYVFTPQGDIIDLPNGATPIDFAYSIHSEVGHRCRGAKIDGVIVPLTYQLKTGQRVEILTAKHSQPSRDWLSPHLGYVNSARTRAKIQQWFRSQDNQLQSQRETLEKPKVKPSKTIPLLELGEKHQTFPAIQMMGVDKLLSHAARCCKPLPGDSVIGYITRSRGVSIHRDDCVNVKHIKNVHPERLLEIAWTGKINQAYAADLIIKALDRSGLLRDITSLLASEKVEILGLQTQKLEKETEVDIFLTLYVTDRSQLNKAVHIIQSIPDILSVMRR